MNRPMFSVMLMAVVSSIVKANINGGGGATGGGGYEQGEVLAEIPNQPMVFNTPEELRTYLQELDKYFAIVGRPRFGRTLGGGYSRSVFPFFRANPSPPAF